MGLGAMNAMAGMGALGMQGLAGLPMLNGMGINMSPMPGFGPFPGMQTISGGALAQLGMQGMGMGTPFPMAGMNAMNMAGLGPMAQQLMLDQQVCMNMLVSCLRLSCILRLL